MKFIIQEPEEELSLQNYTDQFIEVIINNPDIEPFNSIPVIPNLEDSAIIGIVMNCALLTMNQLLNFYEFSADQPPKPPSGDIYIGFIKFIVTEDVQAEIMNNPSNVNTSMTRELETSLKALVRTMMLYLNGH